MTKECMNEIEKRRIRRKLDRLNFNYIEAENKVLHAREVRAPREVITLLSEKANNIFLKFAKQSNKYDLTDLYKIDKKIHSENIKKILIDLAEYFDNMVKQDIIVFEALPLEEIEKSYEKFCAINCEKSRLAQLTISNIRRELCITFSSTYEEKMKIVKKHLKKLNILHATLNEQHAVQKFEEIIKFKNITENNIDRKEYN